MARQSDATKLVAIGLLNFADDEGYFYADEKLIRSALRPFDDDSTTIRRAIDELSKLGYIEVKNHRSHGAIVKVVAFTKHQRVDRPKASIIKELFDSTNNRRTIDEQSTLEQGREQGTGNRERNISGAKAPSCSPSASESFEIFWKSYPRKTGKAKAREIWKRKKPDLETVLAALQWQKASKDWTKDGGDFIPYATTYLNQERYLDEKPENDFCEGSGPTQRNNNNDDIVPFDSRPAEGLMAMEPWDRLLFLKAQEEAEEAARCEPPSDDEIEELESGEVF